jgi:hypothetical protein
MTRLKSEGLAAPVRVAVSRLSWISAVSLSSPIRWRQRVSDERSNGVLCWKNSSPQNSWKYGFSTQRSHKTSSDKSCIDLRIESPAMSRVGSGGWPGLSE